MTSLSSYNLAFVYHTPFWEEDGSIWTSFPPIGLYVDSLAPNFSKIIVVTPPRSGTDRPLYALKASNIELLKVKAHSNIQSFWLQAVSFYKDFFRYAANWDIVNIRMPTLTGFPAYFAANFYGKPFFSVVVGDNLLYVHLADYPPLKKILASTEASLQNLLMKHVMRQGLTFVNGEDLYREFRDISSHMHITRSSTVTVSDFVDISHDTCQGELIHVLTVAVIAPHKGTSLIPEILSRLCGQGVNVVWTYIGDIDGNSGQKELEKVQNLANELGVASRLHFPGSMGWKDLKFHYRSSDIFVLPTLLEGVPRVILEAQAAGLPVITTNVGGIPGAVKHGVDALLCPPRDGIAMTDAILSVIKNGDLRLQLIRNGSNNARQHTLEAETSRMLEKVEQFVSDRCKQSF